MKRTVLERIENLKGMIDRRENPMKVKDEVHAIFEMINQEQDENVKDKALGKMLELALNMVTELDESPLGKIMSVIEKAENANGKVIPVKVNVHEYLDAIVIETDKKLSYSRLIHVIERAVPNFEDNIDDLLSAGLDKKEKQIKIDYINDNHKSIILDLTKWNLSNECLEIYTEGLVEYIQK